MPVAMMRTRVLMAPAMGGRRGLGSNEITLAQERPPQGDPQTPQGIHFTGLEAMLSTDRMWRSRLFGGTRTLPSLPERDFLGVSLVIRGFRDTLALTQWARLPKRRLGPVYDDAVSRPSTNSQGKYISRSLPRAATAEADAPFESLPVRGKRCAIPSKRRPASVTRDPLSPHCAMCARVWNERRINCPQARFHARAHTRCGKRFYIAVHER